MQSIPKNLMAIVFLAVACIMAIGTGKGFADTEVYGEVSGVWRRANSPYLVTGTVTIRDSLIIEPGVVVKFDGLYMIKGYLIARGTQQDTIYFTTDTPERGWGGIISKVCSTWTEKVSSGNGWERTTMNWSGGAIIEYCKVEHVKLAAGIENPRLVSNSLVTHNAKCGIKPGMISKIINCEISHNGGSGINGGNLSVEVDNCIISYNGGDGINPRSHMEVNNCIISYNRGNGIGRHGEADVNNCIVAYNGSNGLTGWGSTRNCIIIHNAGVGLARGYGVANCTICYNKWGMGYASDVINSIIRANKVGQLEYGERGVTYSNVEGGYEGEGNIDKCSFLINIARGDYRLQSKSPCIDRGNVEFEYNDPENPNNPGYALSPAKGKVRNDMGAYGGPGALKWIIDKEWINKVKRKKKNH